jgi:hypothetical protein
VTACLVVKVWAEVLLFDRWVHVDPCEASIDEPQIYEGWGKNLTYILSYSYDTVDDVTSVYASNTTAVMERRQNEGVDEIRFQEAITLTRHEYAKDEMT